MNEIKNIVKLSTYFIKKEFLIIVLLILFISIFDLLTLSLLFTLMEKLINADTKRIFFGIEFIEKIFQTDFFKKNLIQVTFIIFSLSIFFQYIFRVLRSYLMNRIFINYNYFFIKNYADLNFLDFKKKRLSEIYNFLSIYSERIVNHVLDSFMTIISGLILIIILFLPLIFIRGPEFFILFFFLIFIFIILYQSLKKIISIVSNNQLKAEKIKSYEINFLYNYFKFFKLDILFKNNFVNNFNNNIKNYYKLNLIGSSILYLPKFIIEISIIIFIFYFFLRFETGFVKFIPELTIYLFIFYKIFPHLILINTCFKRIKLSKYFIKNTINEITFLSKNIEKISDHKKIKFRTNLVLKKIEFKFNKQQKNIIEYKNIEFKKNKKYLIVGKTGSGKSTFSDIISAVLYLNKFNILIDNKIINSKNLSGYRKIFSIYDGKDNLIPGSLADNITLSKVVDNNSIKFVLEIIGLNKLFDKRILDKNFKIVGNGENISAGQKQLICIARTLYQNNDVLIFDEPTSHLDSKSTYQLIKILSSLKNKTIIIISHNLSLKKYFDKILSFKNFVVTYEKK